MKKIKTDLDSNFGLTSISKYSKFYLANSDAYWKGPVWININYMFLRGLNLYYQSTTDFYQKIRQDLIKTVCMHEEERGYFYENYINGRGSFSYPFTGWTALISIIIRENY
jgi:mannosyl-oligosaccharide glucosidase